MRWLWLFITLLLPAMGLANPDFDRLKARYQAIESGKRAIPTLTQQNQTIAPSDDSANKSNIPEGETLILTLMLQQHRLGDVLGIQAKTEPLLSLSDVSRALDFPITVDTATRTAQGWLRSPSTSFDLSFVKDTEQWQLQIGEENHPTVSVNSILVDDDLYVPVHTLEQWFDIELDINYRALEASISTLKPIPLERKLERQQRSARIRIFDNQPKYPLKLYERSSLSQPVLDLQWHSSLYTSRPNQHSLSILGANELAYFNTQYFLSTDANNELTDARISAARYAPNGTALGVFNATELELGDIRATRITPLDTQRISAGARVSNQALGYRGGNSIDLEGEIPPGWDVEVYRNQLLVASDINVNSGQYYFPNVTLLYGSNNIEVVLYSPQGQIRRDTKSYYVSSTGQQAGEFHYDVSIVDQGNKLLDHYLNESTTKAGTMANTRFSYAPTDWWNLYLGRQRFATATNLNPNATSYGSQLSLFGKALFSADIFTQKSGAYRRQYQLDSAWGSQSLSLVAKHNKTLKRDDNSWLRFRSNELRISGQLQSAPFSYFQSVEHIDNSTTQYYRLTNQIGARIGHYYATNRTSWQNNLDHLTQGSWQLQRYLKGFFWRFGNDYTLHPKASFDNLFTDVSGPFSEHTSGRLSYARNLHTSNQQTTASFSWRPNGFSLTTQLRHNDALGWSANLLGQMSIGRTRSRLFTSQHTLVNRGSVSVLVYHDRNNNGRYDAQDAALPNVEVYSEQTTRREATDSQGIAVLSSLSAFQRTDIDINLATLTDPYMIRRNPGVSIAPHPGVVQSVEIPIVISMEIEGTTLEINQSGKTKPLAYVPIEVRTEKGALYREVLSEFDGYYLIDELPPGNYTLNVQPKYLSKNALITPTKQSIRYAGNDVIAGQNIILRKAFDQSGYSAKLGQFRRLDILKSYWALLNKRYPSLQQHEYFYAGRDQSFTLYSGFSEQPNEARALCQELSPSSCSVQRIRRQ